MDHPVYDVIVAGAGSMGSAAGFQLAARGCRVLLLEQFAHSPHEEGSHAGQTRIIRKAYFEDPGYVPLLERAYAGWKQLEAISGEQVYYQTGLLYAGPQQHAVIRGVQNAAEKFSIPLSEVATQERQIRFPSFQFTSDDTILWEPHAGFLLPEKSISLLLQAAVQKGAVIKTAEKFLDWKKEKSLIRVLTAKNVYHTKKLIITTGAWAGKMPGHQDLPLKVTRQVLIWIKPRDPEQYGPGNFPCWMIAVPGIPGVYYGFPYLSGEKFPGPAGLKFAWHHPGIATDPDQVNRETGRDELQGIVEGIASRFPALQGEIVMHKTCLYTNTPDENFIIDFMPGAGGDVIIACGFSGHGFKFVPVVGEILADLAIHGSTGLPIGFLGVKRFG